MVNIEEAPQFASTSLVLTEVSMSFFKRAGANTVSVHGAPAGSILCGAGVNNQGLRLRISQEQSRGNSGPIQGLFMIMNTGDNKHSDSLTPLLNRTTDAATVVRVTRERYAGCVSVANANILVVECVATTSASEKRPAATAQRVPDRLQ
ncbi:hypothetical protein AYO40_04675 [Planctomycetaceae bacterium SCGC AG-212-D15]|nr:hypothetical protein AYO40_04675 [Planctomycetaceae bacterium SCGC AG-212-D15]